MKGTYHKMTYKTDEFKPHKYENVNPKLHDENDRILLDNPYPMDSDYVNGTYTVNFDDATENLNIYQYIAALSGCESTFTTSHVQLDPDRFANPATFLRHEIDSIDETITKTYDNNVNNYRIDESTYNAIVYGDPIRLPINKPDKLMTIQNYSDALNYIDNYGPYTFDDNHYAKDSVAYRLNRAHHFQSYEMPWDKQHHLENGPEWKKWKKQIDKEIKEIKNTEKNENREVEPNDVDSKTQKTADKQSNDSEKTQHYEQLSLDLDGLDDNSKQL